MRKTDDKGFAIVGSAIIVALAIFMGFGAAVIMQRSSMLHQSKLSGQRVARNAHEDLNVVVDRMDGNADVTLTNRGSVTSSFDRILVRKGGEGLNVYSVDSSLLNPVESTTKTLDFSVDEEDTIGVYTRLGNIFWEAS